MKRTGDMNKEEIYRWLKTSSISYEITEHKAVYNMAELSEAKLPWPEAIGKNLFIRDDKKRGYYLITMRGDKTCDLKAFRKEHGLRALSLAPAGDLEAILGLLPGAVTPLGLLNDEARQVKFFLDRDFLKPPGLAGVHPNENRPPSGSARKTSWRSFRRTGMKRSGPISDGGKGNKKTKEKQ